MDDQLRRGWLVGWLLVGVEEFSCRGRRLAEGEVGEGGVGDSSCGSPETFAVEPLLTGLSRDGDGGAMVVCFTGVRCGESELPSGVVGEEGRMLVEGGSGKRGVRGEFTGLPEDAIRTTLDPRAFN